MRRPPTRSWSSPPAANSTRSAPTGCRAGAAMASRSASSSTWRTTRTSSPPSSTTPGRKLLLVSHEGNGFIVPEAEVVANTRKGKQVMNVRAPDEAARCVISSGDHVAIVGENRKMLVFALADVPEMARGKGVRLQKVQGWRLSRHQDLRHGVGPDLAGFRRPHLREVARRACRMDRCPRLGRTHRAEGFPEDGQVRVAIAPVRHPARPGCALRHRRLHISSRSPATPATMTAQA